MPTKIYEKLFRVVQYACLPPLAVLAAASATNSFAQEKLTFPARASDLQENSYWSVAEFSEGCCTLDLNVVRWTGRVWGGTSGSSSNSQQYDWGVPYYSPANGVVASCWRSFPDDPAGGNHPESNRIFGGGNHLMILTDEGNVISVAHMQQNSVPTDLCPTNNDGTEFPTTTSKEGSWRVASYIEPALRPRVSEGQFIGRAGNSGRSSGVHLHISTQEVIGTDPNERELLSAATPLLIRNAWAHRYERDQNVEPAGWFPLMGEGMVGDPNCAEYRPDSPECGFELLHASPFLRRAAASAGTIEDVDTAFLSPNRAVTAVIDSNNELKLVSWDLIGTNRIERNADISAGAIKDVKIAYVSSNRVLVAVRTASDDLKLIAYHVIFNGDFVRLDEHSAGKISSLDLTVISSTPRRAVTAVRDSDGNLKLIAWEIATSTQGESTIRRLASADAGNVSAVSIARARSFTGVYTAVRDAVGELKVIPWRLSSDGIAFSRGASGSAGAVGKEISVHPLARGVAVAAQEANGNLKLITWSSDTSGNILRRMDSATAGAVDRIRLIGTPYSDSNLVTVVRDGSQELLLIGWAIDDDGRNIRRLGSSSAGKIDHVAVDSSFRNDARWGYDTGKLLTAIRDNSGNLKLITWETNLGD